MATLSTGSALPEPSARRDSLAKRASFNAGRHVRAFATLLGVIAVTGCGEDPPAGPLQLNRTNNLSVIVSFDAGSASEARVVYESETGESGATPYQPVTTGTNHIATLGHLPDTTYTYTVELRGPEGPSSEEIGELTTGRIPAELEPLAPGADGELTYDYVLLTYKSFVVALDQDARIRWYRSIDGVAGRDAAQVANGNFVAFIGETTGAEALPGHYVEFTPAGEMVREYHAPEGLFFDNHELLLTDLDAATPTSHFFTILPEQVDLTDVGGPASATVVGHQIIRMKNGEVDFRWDALDHLPVDGATALIPDFLERCADACDYDHPNSLQITPDGNYLASWAVLSEITKIDSTTGEVQWRLGGKYNEFQFVNDPLQGFGGQHHARILDSGNLLLYDNGHNHQEEGSRAVEYALDLEAMTATLVWEYRAAPLLFTLIVGTAERLQNGNTFIGFTGNVDLRRTSTARKTWSKSIPTGSSAGERTFRHRTSRFSIAPCRCPRCTSTSSRSREGPPSTAQLRMSLGRAVSTRGRHPFRRSGQHRR